MTYVLIKELTYLLSYQTPLIRATVLHLALNFDYILLFFVKSIISRNKQCDTVQLIHQNVK